MIFILGSNNNWSKGFDLFHAMNEMKSNGTIDKKIKFVAYICHDSTIVTETGGFQHPKGMTPVRLGYLNHLFRPIQAPE